MDKYKGIAAWHKRLADEVLATGCITTPSGRAFAFPDATRNKHGGVTYFTQIKNYPVQSFATADIVPICLIYMTRCWRQTRCRVVSVNTVHDSVVLDIHPDENRQGT